MNMRIGLPMGPGSASARFAHASVGMSNDGPSPPVEWVKLARTDLLAALHGIPAGTAGFWATLMAEYLAAGGPLPDEASMLGALSGAGARWLRHRDVLLTRRRICIDGATQLLHIPWLDERLASAATARSKASRAALARHSK